MNDVAIYFRISNMIAKELLALLERFSRGEVTALDVRRRMDDATYGDVLVAMGAANLPLPIASQKGREDRIALAKNWLFHN